MMELEALVFPMGMGKTPYPIEPLRPTLLDPPDSQVQENQADRILRQTFNKIIDQIMEELLTG